MTETTTLIYNYRNRRWRTWYIIALGSIASLYFDSLWAGVFVLLATVDVERAPATGKD